LSTLSGEGVGKVSRSEATMGPLGWSESSECLLTVV
jgi:hypothetical protein